MRPLALMGVVLLAAASAAASAPKFQQDPYAGFEKVRSDGTGAEYADRAMKLLIDVPTGYVLVTPKKNEDVAYEFAFRHPTRRFEVRVSLSAKTEDAARVKEREACAKKAGCWMADLDSPSETWGAAVMFNVGGGDTPFFAFPPDAVKKEFAADWGYVSSPFELEPGHTFNDEAYKIGQVVVIHRKGAGTVCRIVLADDLDAIKELDQPLFYGVRFEGARPPGANPPEK
jgi:hypothetical protein